MEALLITSVSPPRRKRAAQALLFDLDGILWDPEPHVFRAYAEVFREYGQELTRKSWDEVIGTIGFDLWTPLEDLAGRPLDRSHLEASVERRKEEGLRRAGARPGIAELLRQADEAGLSRSIVSNSSGDWITRYARQCGVDSGWHAVHSPEGETDRGKPEPDLYLEAVDRLGLRPEEAVAFEDSPNGVSAARAAGVPCVAVPNAMTAPLDLSHADLRIESFRGAELRRILDRLAAKDQ